MTQTVLTTVLSVTEQSSVMRHLTAFQLVIPVQEERNVTVPARRPATPVLIRQVRPVPMTAMCVPMMSVTVREPVHILRTPHPVMTVMPVPPMIPALVERV
jgi:hypothetical protein